MSVPTPACAAPTNSGWGRRRARIPRQEEAAGPRAGACTTPTSSESSFGSSHHGDRPLGVGVGLSRRLRASR
jgi:hypothetical protein